LVAVVQLRDQKVQMETTR